MNASASEGIPEDVTAHGGEFDVGHFADDLAESADILRVRHEPNKGVYNW